MGIQLSKIKRKYLIIGIVALIVLIVVLIVISTKKKPINSTANDWYINYEGKSFSNTGILYSDNGYLRYADIKSKLDVLICDNAACSHRRDVCSAYFDGTINIGVIEEQKLMLITNYGSSKLGEMYLYEASYNGENRKKIADFDNIQYISQAVFEEDYIVIAYSNTYDENLEKLELPIAGIYVYNRTTGEGQSIYEIEGWNTYINALTLSNDMIYYSCISYDITKEEALEHADDITYMNDHNTNAIYSINVNGENHVKIHDTDDTSYMMVCNDTIFYNDQDQLFSYDIVSGESNLLGESMSLVPTYVDNTMLFYKYNKELKEIEFYIYDDNLNSIRSLGSMADCIPVAVFSDVVYAYYYGTETGEGIVIYFTTDQFMKGNMADYEKIEKMEE